MLCLEGQRNQKASVLSQKNTLGNKGFVRWSAARGQVDVRRFTWYGSHSPQPHADLQPPKKAPTLANLICGTEFRGLFEAQDNKKKFVGKLAKIKQRI